MPRVLPTIRMQAVRYPAEALQTLNFPEYRHPARANGSVRRFGLTRIAWSVSAQTAIPGTVC